MAEINCKNVTAMNLGDQGFEIQDSCGNGESVYIPNDGERTQAAYEEREIIAGMDAEKLTNAFIRTMEQKGMLNHARVNATEAQLDMCCRVAKITFPGYIDGKIQERCRKLGLIDLSFSSLCNRSFPAKPSKVNLDAICDKAFEITFPDVRTGEIQDMCRKLRNK